MSFTHRVVEQHPITKTPCSVLMHLGPFRRLMKLGSKWAELVRLMQKFVPRRHIRIFRNERTRSTPFDPNLMFYCVLWCLGASGIISSPYETWLKWAELVQSVQKIVPQSCIGIFRKEHTRSTPLDPKLMFRCVSNCLGAFGTVSSPYETRFKTGRTGAINAKVRATKSC